MARYDKYDPISGGFRAPLAADWTSEAGKPYVVGLDSNGKVVKGSGQTGMVGVLILTRNMKAGDIVDVMSHGEIVEATASDGTTALAAGTAYYGVGADGTISATATSNRKIGYTVEATRLVVRMGAHGTGA